MAGDADHPLRIGGGEPHAVEQGVRLVQGVAVEQQHVAVARVVEPAVGRVRLRALVLLPNHLHVLVGAASIDARHGRALDDSPFVVAERLEVELALEHLERAVGRAVVDDDHLELGIVEREHRRTAIITMPSSL